MAGLPTYPDCKIKREPPSINIDKDLMKEVAEKVSKDFKVLPVFEKFLFEYKYRKFYSLVTNKFLHCRWRSYLKHYEDREFAPFTFVDKRDFHFYNGMIRLLPSESIHRTKEFPYKMGLGPGVDFRGQMPIPQDIMMKRGMGKPKAERKVYIKAKKEGDDENKDKKPETKNPKQ